MKYAVVEYRVHDVALSQVKQLICDMLSNAKQTHVRDTLSDNRLASTTRQVTGLPSVGALGRFARIHMIVMIVCSDDSVQAYNILSYQTGGVRFLPLGDTRFNVFLALLVVSACTSLLG